jgi:PmbA protein
MRWWVAVEQTDYGSKDDVQALTDNIIRAGSDLVEEIEVYIVTGYSVFAELKKTATGLASGNMTMGLGIRTIDHGRTGTSGTNNPGSWKMCLHAAVASGTLATSQEWGGLPGPGLQGRPLLAFDPAVNPDAGQAGKFLHQMLNGAGKYPVRVTSGSAGLSVGELTMANSRGILYTSKKTFVSLSLEAIKGQSTGYEFDQSTTMAVDPVKVGEKAAFFAHHGESGGEVPTGEYDIILSPVALAQFLGNVVMPAVNGRNVHAGRSKLAGSTGEQVMDPKISLDDDPFIPGAPGSTWWDAEGVPTRRIGIVENGVLNEFLYDLKTAYRYGKTSTGSAVRTGYGSAPGIGHHNLVLDGPRSEIWYGDAIYIHDVVGAHTANPMSGDFSVEISNPSWVDNGGFGAPIRKVMYAGNAFSMLNNIEGIAKGNRNVGSMVLPEVRISGQRIIGT